MTITEKNEVIARFIGLEWDDCCCWFKKYNPETDSVGTQSNELKYHSSLNWLMPACQKFCSDDSIVYTNHYLKVSDAINKFLFREATILDIHQALYEGIEWLNKQQNKEV